ncbi:MAG: hypothetical protein GY795_10275 [Desulfobacterales bacterium]|nr:hypothetical protein [Desulfobacterales bacterium]
MSGKKFDPRKFIDRDFEQELFEELLQCNDEARILAVKDDGGMGKSNLLEKFQYRCRTVKPRTPVSLVSLDQLPENSPLVLVQRMEKDLSAFIEFPAFTRNENARKACDFATIRGTVDFRGANMREANIKTAGIMANASHVENLTMSNLAAELTPEQQGVAQEMSVHAFFDDLKNHCVNSEQPVVLMLDAYEKCDNNLQTWLMEYFLERYYFDIDNRPLGLLLVIAGRKIPDFELLWSAEDCNMLIRSVKELSKWTKKHMEECLCVHSFPYNQKDLDTFYNLIEMGLPPSQVVDLIKTAIAVRRKQI